MHQSMELLIARIVLRARRQRGPFVLCLPLTFWYLGCWSAGQGVGLLER